MIDSPVRRRAARLTAAVSLVIPWLLAWMRGEQVADDRGSDSSEKAFMIILAIALGAAVTVAAVAFVNSKTALFK